MKKRMFNFTAVWAVICIIAYVLMLTLFIYTTATWEDNTLSAIVTALICISLIMLVWYFVIMAPQLGDNAIKQGAKSIKKSNVKVKCEYVAKFRETELVITDRAICYGELSRPQQEKHAIIIQATYRNVKMLNDWLGISITVPPKPKRKSYLGIFKH